MSKIYLSPLTPHLRKFFTLKLLHKLQKYSPVMLFRLLLSSFLGTILAFIINIYVFDILSYYHYFKDTFINKDRVKGELNLFTNEKLSQYNGQIKEELYLSILGVVYDVTKGKKHYGPGESYHAFIGRDASQSFITGDFNTNNLSDDISKLSSEELLSLEKWKEFYDKEYIKKGKLIGRYYDANGNPTEYARNVEQWISEAKSNQNRKENQNKLFPPCNIEWDAVKGTRVWCTEKSGGIQRNWIGYPVKYFEPGANSFRCACVKSYKETANIKQYNDCYLKRSCYIQEDDDD